mgnify:CR=1 FL=1
MKYLFFGDIHANYAYPDYMQFLEKTMSFLLQVIRERKPDLVVCLGDVMDTFGILDLKTLIWAYQTLHEVEKATNRHLVILSGNHDVADADGRLSAVEVLGGELTVTSIGKAQRMGEMVMAPYGCDTQAALGMIDKDVKFLASHWEWTGCRLTPSHVSEKGVDPEDFAKAYPGVKVFNGHYHAPSQVGPVTFVGSPCFRNFADYESDIPRGFTLYDSNTGATERIANPHSYRMVTIRVETEAQLTEALSKISDKDKVKLRIFAPKAITDAVEAIRDKFLWTGTYRTDSEKTDIHGGAAISLTASAADVIAQAVAAAPDGYDRVRLRKMGEHAFRGL